MARQRRSTRHAGIVEKLNGGVTGRGGGTHTFTTVKGWCTPARTYITKAFKPLGISAKWGGIQYHYEKDEEGKRKEFPSEQTQTVTVNESQADWAEYVLGAVSSQTTIEVTDGIRSRANYNKGKARRGVPMPWLYDAMGEIPKDDVQACAKTKEEEKAVKEAIDRGELSGFRHVGMKFTHEGRRRSQDAQAATKKGKRTGKTTGTRKRPQKATGASRGSHRGRHRGR